jgi:hypothetical protein
MIRWRVRSRRYFEAYVRAYLGEIDDIRYADIPSLQPAPFAGLARGAGGIPYMLWRLGRARAARAWLDALRGDRRRAAYAFGEFRPVASSYMYGRAGLTWVNALAAGPAQPRPILEYVRAARAVNTVRETRGVAAKLAFMEHAAGHLTASRLLLAQREHPALRTLANELAARLLAGVRARARRPWTAEDAYGFAYGWSGALHSLVAWHRFAAMRLPRWLAEGLRQLATVAPVAGVPDRDFAATWCNGGAGTTLLWTETFAATGDQLFLDAARTTARAALAVDERRNYLCCGLGGVAYALLALARLDARGPWLEHAREVGLRAIEPVPMHWPNGLYLGHPGLVCLATDLASDTPRGFPAIEA